VNRPVLAGGAEGRGGGKASALVLEEQSHSLIAFIQPRLLNHLPIVLKKLQKEAQKGLYEE